MMDGKDVLDTLLSVSDESPSPVELTFTDRHSVLRGSIESESGRPVSTDVIVVFPADRALRRAGSRRVRTARATTDGTYAIYDLPGGDYLVAAVMDFDPDAVFAPTFFDEVLGRAVMVRIGDGEQSVRNLRISR